MKYLNILTICLLCTVVTIFSCGSEDPVRQQARENLVVPETPSLPPGTTPAATPPAEPAQNAAGVWHYTCSNGCAGGGGAAGPCGVCGNQLAHNQGYHANNNTPAATTPGMPAVTATPSNTPTPPVLPKAAEPAQNAAGVWHYTCTNGCAGGGGSAGTCGSCGGTLAHNQAYH